MKTSINNLVLLNNNLRKMLIAVAVVLSVYLAYFYNAQFFQVIVIIASLILAVFAIKSDKIWIPILIILLPIRGFQLGSLWGAGALRIGDIFIAYIFLLWLFNNIIRYKSASFFRSNLDIFLVFFILFYIFSLFWSINADLGLIRVVKFVRNFFIYILIRELFIKDFQSNYRRAAICFCIMGTALGAVYIFSIFKGVTFEQIRVLFEKQTLTSTDLGFWRNPFTGAGFFMNGVVNFLILAGIFTLGWLNSMRTKVKRGLILFFSIIMFFVASIGTLSRSAIMCVFVVFIVLLIGNYKINGKKHNGLFISIILFFIIVSFSLGLHKLILKRFNNSFQDGSWMQRKDLAQVAIKGFQASPIIGIGVGSNFTWQSLYAEQIASRIPDNLYLNILSEVGLVGSLCFLAIIFLWLKYLFDCMRDGKADPYMRNISLAILAFSVSYLLAALISQEFESFEAWIMLGVASAIKNIQIRDREVLINNNVS